MGFFLRVSFGTVVAIWTAVVLLMLLVAAGSEDAEMAYAALTLEGVLAAVVATGWGLWLVGRWARRH